MISRFGTSRLLGIGYTLPNEKLEFPATREPPTVRFPAGVNDSTMAAGTYSLVR